MAAFVFTQEGKLDELLEEVRKLKSLVVKHDRRIKELEARLEGGRPPQDRPPTPPTPPPGNNNNNSTV